MKRIVIVDISSIKLNENDFCNYGKVTMMYKKLFKSIDEDVMIAGETVYRSKTLESKRIDLPYDFELECAKSRVLTFLMKTGSVINGISLFSKLNDDIVICQPYSFQSWMISILTAKRITDIYLILGY